MNPQIFISIAAYREHDLVATLRDCCQQAAHQERLRFVICWQHDEQESLDEFATDPRVTVIDVPFQDSPGVGWARHQIQLRYDDEPFALQIDGHHRFVEDWDLKCIHMVQQLREEGYPKPILTQYAPSFHPTDEPGGRTQEILTLGFHRFEPQGCVFFRPTVVRGQVEKPILGRFWSAHFSFSGGEFFREVSFDPTIYFHSEEISIGTRAWTHGFDLFHPHQLILWHEYSRRDRTCHWNDHSDWGFRQSETLKRYRSFFGVDGTPRIYPSEHGWGQKRSLEEFERFAGICFETRGVELETLQNQPPTGCWEELSRSEWQECLLTSYSKDLRLERTWLEEPASSWNVFCNSSSGEKLFEIALSSKDIVELAERGAESLLLDFCSTETPKSWSVWRKATTGDWLPPIVGVW